MNFAFRNLLLTSFFLIASAHSRPADAAPLYSEVINGRGVTRQNFLRDFTVPTTGRYFLVIANGSKSRDRVRMDEAHFEINGRNPSEVPVVTAGTAAVNVPIELIAGANQIRVDYLGATNARLSFSIDSNAVSVAAKNSDAADERAIGGTSIHWRLDANDPRKFLFFVDSQAILSEKTQFGWLIDDEVAASKASREKQFKYSFKKDGAHRIRLQIREAGKVISTEERVVAVGPIERLVPDEVVYEDQKLRGALSGHFSRAAAFDLAAPTLARLKVRNGDGADHLSRPCSNFSFLSRVGCEIANLRSEAYRSLFRVQSFEVRLNGETVVSRDAVNGDLATLDTVVALGESNKIELQGRGGLLATAGFELQILELNTPPEAHLSRIEGFKTIAPADGSRIVEFNAADSTDDNDQVVNYRFQAKLRGSDQPVALDSDWQADPRAALAFKTPGTYDVVASARDKFGAVGTSSSTVQILTNTPPVLTQQYYRVSTNIAPYAVRVEARATDADVGDTLQYNFEFSNGQTTGFTSAQNATTTFASAGSYSVIITVRDAAGATATATLPIVVGNNIVPIASFTMSPRGAASPNTISFDASSSADPDGLASSLRYFWTFGDGSPEVEAKIVTHTFAAGEWVVTLNVIDARSGIGSSSKAVFSWTNAAPIPSYTVTPGASNLQMTFNASASTAGDSAIASYKFELGNGLFQTTTSSTMNYTYAAAGVYSTSLRVYDQEGDANITSKSITVFNGTKPTANLRTVSYDLVNPATFNFDTVGSVSPTSGATITGYKWTMPGGAIVTTSSATYTTSSQGTFSVQLEVQDSTGTWSDPVVKSFRAVTGELPIAIATVDKTTVALGQLVSLSASGSYSKNPTANLSTYEWTFPSGNKSYGMNITGNLTSTGLKTISLKVTDSKGYVSNVATVQVNVIARQNPVASFVASGFGTGIVPVTLHVNGTGSSTPNPGSNLTSYEWRITAPTSPTPIDFSLFGSQVDILMNQVTTYTVALRVFDSAGGTSSWVTQTFGPTANTIPVAVISSGVFSDTAPASFTFSGIGSSDPDGHTLVSWHWLFSDGSDAYGPTASHTFASPGTYTATLSVQDEYWAWSDPVSVTVTVIPNTAPIVFGAVSNIPGSRYQKSLSAAGSYDPDGSIVSYQWFTVGGSNIATGVTTTYTFPSAGTISVGLTATDNKGSSTTIYLSPFTIVPNSPPVPKFVSSINNSATRTVDFDATTSTDDVSIVSYLWTFSGGATATGATVQHSFSSGGFATVQLTVTDNEGASRSISKSVSIQSLPVTQNEVMRCEAR